MKIKKGTLIKVKHSRSGTWTGIADRDFDTEEETFYPVSLAQDISVEGLTNVWHKGDSMPCRNTLCTIEELKEASDETEC
ncbi:hypothetical protein LCGC14_1590470 [marine sediment metagenome]|uniref:Hypervirulence associated protein TUDOR domain-containing protein n=1 Tax=marine sediment metagenome TaxID=412755 RepID=A0A0F9LEK4_9ZZZZ